MVPLALVGLGLALSAALCYIAPGCAQDRVCAQRCEASSVVRVLAPVMMFSGETQVQTAIGDAAYYGIALLLQMSRSASHGLGAGALSRIDFPDVGEISTGSWQDVFALELMVGRVCARLTGCAAAMVCSDFGGGPSDISERGGGGGVAHVELTGRRSNRLGRPRMAQSSGDAGATMGDDRGGERYRHHRRPGQAGRVIGHQVPPEVL